MKPILHVLAAAATVLTLAPSLAAAQNQAQVARTVVAEPVAVVPAFLQWVQATAVPVLEQQSITTTVQPVTLPAPPSAPPGLSRLYQPRPVILGAPELPLLRPVADAGWAESFNYQGMHVQVIALDASGRQRKARPLSQTPRAGERFKLRITPTFDAVADIDLVTGDGFSRSRVGQVYPQPGFSVQIKAGETADLPLGAASYFVMPQSQALVLSVRHPQALGDTGSNQPAYRIDGLRGSDFLQLVPEQRAPLIEQMLVAR